jgi:hypothetical protein
MDVQTYIYVYIYSALHIYSPTYIYKAPACMYIVHHYASTSHWNLAAKYQLSTYATDIHKRPRERELVGPNSAQVRKHAFSKVCVWVCVWAERLPIYCVGGGPFSGLSTLCVLEGGG